MGQLTNLYVSQSYQGLIKLANSTTGVTGTLQYTQDGLGNNLPIQISTSSVNITGSFTVNGLPVQADTGSLVSTSSFNAYTSSNDSKVNSLISATGSYATTSSLTTLSGSIATTDLSQNNRLTSIESITGSLATTSSLTNLSQSIAVTDLGQNNRLGSLETATGSLQNQINQKLDTGSFNSYTSSNDSKVNSLIASTGSYATTSSLTSLSQSIALTDLNQNNTIAGLATTSSVNTKLDTGSFNSYTSSNDGKVNSLINATGSYVTESETGSFVIGVALVSPTEDQINVLLANGTSGSFTINNVQSASFATNALSASYAPMPNVSGFATTGSNIFQGNQTISGSLIVTGSITALSASITYLQTVYQTSSIIFSSGSNILGDEAGDTQTLNGVVNIPLGNLNITGATTSSLGFFGNLQGTASFASNANSASYAPTIIPNWVATTGSNQFIGNQGISGSVTLTGAVIGATSIFLQPDANDVRYLQVYNTSPTDTHITASGGQIFLGDDQTYVKVDNYGSVERIDIVAGNELVISSSIVNVTGSLIAPSITGSLQGTASYAINALSASNSVNSDSSISSSFAQTAISSSQSQNAVSASQSTNANTASYVLQAVSASYSNYAVSSSQSENSVSASYSNNSTSASYANNATSASFSQNTISGSFSNFAVSSSYAQTASFASNGGVTQILAGPNIIVSPLSGQGQVTISSTGTGTGSFNTATGSYGSFYDTTTQ
jgi:hypothetical protein